MKKLITILFAVALGLNLSAQVPNYVPSDGLVAWYPFNGNANDESGNGNDGVVVGASPIEDRHGLPFHAYEFSGNQEYISIEHDSTFISTDLTLSFWCYSAAEEFVESGSLIGWNALLNKTSPGSNLVNRYFQVVLGTTTSALSAPYNIRSAASTGVAVDPGSSVESAETDFIIQPNNWYHIVTTFTDSTIRIHADGTLIAETDLLNSRIPNNAPILIGRPYCNQANCDNRYLIGLFDDFGFWNRSLTEEEILALYNAQLPVPGCTDSIACNFNEEANIEDNSCVYPLFGEDCETGGAACGEGTIWDANIQACVVSDFCQEDLDGDGVIGVNDLMQLLSMLWDGCARSLNRQVNSLAATRSTTTATITLRCRLGSSAGLRRI